MAVRLGNNKWNSGDYFYSDDFNDTFNFMDSSLGTTFYVFDQNEEKIVKIITDSNGATLINECDDSTDWSGTSVSVDTVYFLTGTGSIKDEVSSPTDSTEYATAYTPTSPLDLSNKNHIFFKLKNTRNSTDFSSVVFRVKTDASNYADWNLSFTANIWTDFLIDLANPDSQTGTVNLASVSSIEIVITTADTTAFTTWIDTIYNVNASYLINVAYNSNDITVDYYESGTKIKTIIFYIDSKGRVYKTETS